MTPIRPENRADPMPSDIAEWLRLQGWTHTGSLGDIAQRWQNGTVKVVVPMLTTSPDFALRWSELLNRLGESFDTGQQALDLQASDRAGEAGQTSCPVCVPGSPDQPRPVEHTCDTPGFGPAGGDAQP